jgi:hypothetical protein
MAIAMSVANFWSFPRTGPELRLSAMNSAQKPVQIPTHSGQVFRFEAGRDSDLMPATVPN